MKLTHPASAIGWAFLIVAALAATCIAQTSPAEQRRAGGERVITGCLQRQGTGFAIQASDGTYELNTDRDLSAYVGKQVRISGKWEASGTFTTAPVGNAPSPSTPAAPGEANAPTPAFVGDLHLHITGTVIGDCAAPK